MENQLYANYILDNTSNTSTIIYNQHCHLYYDIIFVVDGNVKIILENKEYYIPPIIMDDKKLVSEWIEDISSVGDVTPQGELVLINEKGKYEDFILKCKEDK